MSRWPAVLGIGVGALLAAGIVAASIARAGWNRATARALEALAASEAKGRLVPGTTFSASELEQLPPPVARYLAFAVPDGQPRIVSATIHWTGEFRTTPQNAWSPFTARQHFAADPPGFVWDARIRMMPLASVHVRDGYRAGSGSMQARVAGVVPVVDERGTPEIAQSALARWLGETVWFPTALLPGGPVRWEAIDECTARAVVRDGGTEASAEFQFGPSGEILRMTALRYRDVDGRPELTPFEGEYGDYVSYNGVKVPGRSEVAWLLPAGRFVYWRGRPASIEYVSSSGSRRGEAPR